MGDGPKCAACKRRLKRPTTSGLGPVCERRLNGPPTTRPHIASPAAAKPGPEQAELPLDDQLTLWTS